MLQSRQHCSDQTDHSGHCSQLCSVTRAQVSPHPETAGGGGGPAVGGEGGEHRHEGGEDGLQGRRAGEVRSVSDTEEAVTQDRHQLGAGHGRQLKLNIESRHFLVFKKTKAAVGR